MFGWLKKSKKTKRNPFFERSCEACDFPISQRFKLKNKVAFLCSNCFDLYHLLGHIGTSYIDALDSKDGGLGEVARFVSDNLEVARINKIVEIRQYKRDAEELIDDMIDDMLISMQG